MAHLSIYRLFEIDNEYKVRPVGQKDFKEKYNVNSEIFSDLKATVEKNGDNSNDTKYKFFQILDKNDNSNNGTYIYGINLTQTQAVNLATKKAEEDKNFENIKTITIEELKEKYSNNEKNEKTAVEENNKIENNKVESNNLIKGKIVAIDNIIQGVKELKGKMFLFEKAVYEANTSSGTSGRFLHNGYGIASPISIYNMGKIGIALNFIEFGMIRLNGKTYDVKRFRKRYIKQDGKVKIEKIGIAIEKENVDKIKEAFEKYDINSDEVLKGVVPDEKMSEFLKDKGYVGMTNPVVFEVNITNDMFEINPNVVGRLSAADVDDYEKYRKENAIKKCANYLIEKYEFYKEDRKPLAQFSDLSKEYLDELYDNEGKFGIKLDIASGIISEREPKGTPYKKDESYVINYMEKGWSVNPKGQYILDKALVDDKGTKLTANTEILNTLYNQEELETLRQLNAKLTQGVSQEETKTIKDNIIAIRDKAEENEKKYNDYLSRQIIACCIEGDYKNCVVEGFNEIITKKDSKSTGKYENGKMVISGNNGINIVAK